MDLDRSLFRFETSVRVRNYEVDWQGIVHNATYLFYCETGRIAYLEAMGVQINLEAIRKESLIVVARNEIDYLSPARYGETLKILTRISEIRNSSFIFEGIIESGGDGRRIAENRSFHVWLDEETG
ncbi:MAG: acyl-CoA thioesterase, partial [Ignavibacteria bacterium]|nr:acyl-CoA thioesterase [Ignavibacteria bacterium]